METNSGQEMRVAVKCKVCQRVIFYKTTPLSGKIELKCPKCHQITQINLASDAVKRRCFTDAQPGSRQRLFFNIPSWHRATGYGVNDPIMKHHQIAGHENDK